MYQTECLIASVKTGDSYGNGGFCPATICSFIWSVSLPRSISRNSETRVGSSNT